MRRWEAADRRDARLAAGVSVTCAFFSALGFNALPKSPADMTWRVRARGIGWRAGNLPDSALGQRNGERAPVETAMFGIASRGLCVGSRTAGFVRDEKYGHDVLAVRRAVLWCQEIWRIVGYVAPRMCRTAFPRVIKDTNSDPVSNGLTPKCQQSLESALA